MDSRIRPILVIHDPGWNPWNATLYRKNSGHDKDQHPPRKVTTSNETFEFVLMYIACDMSQNYHRLVVKEHPGCGFIVRKWLQIRQWAKSARDHQQDHNLLAITDSFGSGKSRIKKIKAQKWCRVEWAILKFFFFWGLAKIWTLLVVAQSRDLWCLARARTNMYKHVQENCINPDD